LNARNFGAMAAAPALQNGTFFVYGGTGGVLVSKDDPGQLNSIDMESFQWSQTVLPGAALPSQPGGKSSSSMVVVGNSLWLQLADTNELYRVAYGSNANFAALPQQDCHNDPIPAWRTAHGILMGLSWGFLLPLGVFIARFGRGVFPQGKWFKLHRAINMVGLTMAVLGFIIALLMVSTGKFLAVPHSYIGIVVTFLGIMQPINAYFRPHLPEDPNEPKSRGRAIWEVVHKYGGRIALLLGLINPFYGIVYLSGSASSPGFIVYSVWVAVYVLVWLSLTSLGLPWEANGPSKIAQFANKVVVCLPALDDRFKSRSASDVVKP
jgi:hypothetical protein